MAGPKVFPEWTSSLDISRKSCNGRRKQTTVAVPLPFPEGAGIGPESLQV